MKFKPVKRPNVTRPPVIRRMAEVCPFCGAVEQFRANHTETVNGQIRRYSTCAKCHQRVVRLLTIPKKAAQ